MTEDTGNEADPRPSAELPEIETRHLGRDTDGRRLLDDVSVAVARGEVLAVTGPSGSGKSSLLRLLNRLDEPTRGTVLLRGVDYRQIEPRELRRRVGMVLQSPFLFPGTVAENLRFGPRQRGEVLSRETIESLLADVRLAGYADRDVARLSGGEAQRVSLARTLANSPEVLLLDEPTSSLDEATEREVELLISQILEASGLTCLLVTHDREQAARMARRAMILEGGRLVRIGPTEEVLDARTALP